jgi:5'-nucleotidase
MNKPIIKSPGARLMGPLKACIALGLAVTLSGCFWIAARQDIARDGTHPWWCQGGTATLTDNECLSMSAHMDFGVKFAKQYWNVADFQAAGAAPDATGETPQSGTPYKLAPTSSFNAMSPNMIWYATEGGMSRPVAVGWGIDDTATGAPAGFPGDQDVWTLSGGTYYLSVRVLRGYENQPNVFATGHPCISSGVSSLTSTTDACYTGSHPVELEILVTNDDGIGSDGIDAIVQGLKTVSGITFSIVAPATQQSGSGGNTTSGPLTASPASTVSGDLGTAVDGFPADAVIYAMRDLKLSPDLTLSGINDGQNLASVGSSASGTIGAARRALQRTVPAIALSQGGITVTPDFPAGVAASLALLEQWRLGKAGEPFMALPNLNIPSCASPETVTGTVESIVGLDGSSGALNGGNYFSAQNCASTKTVFVDDLDAFLNGWNSIGDMGKVQPPNYP